MPITLTTAYLAQLHAASNTPNTIVALELDVGTRKYGQHAGGFFDVTPALGQVSNRENKIDPKSGYSGRGTITLTIMGREIVQRLLNNRLLGRHAVRYDGFVGTPFSDYAQTFSGKITEWSREKDVLTIRVSDDLEVGKYKLPVENATKTQTLSYLNANPVDIMHDMLSSRMNISTVYIDSTQFTAERDLWLQAVRFNRVLTRPVAADQLLNELQNETYGFIFHDGARISFKEFAPVVPGQTVETYTNNEAIIDETLEHDAGYDQLANRVIVYYNYDESGDDGVKNYESIYIAQDSSSLSTSEWASTRTREVRSRWIRSRTFAQSTMSGVSVYHASYDNSTGTGTLIHTTGATANTLQWKAPNSSVAGDAVRLNKSGPYQLFDGSDTAKSVRVVVETTALPAGTTSADIVLSDGGGDAYVAALALRLLARYRDPVAEVKFDIDINKSSWQGAYIRPTDIKNITSGDLWDHRATSWSQEPVMLTVVRPDSKNGRVHVRGVQTRLYRKYGFIAPAGYPNWDAASQAEREYAFIADSSGQLGGSTANAYYIW